MKCQGSLPLYRFLEEVERKVRNLIFRILVSNISKLLFSTAFSGKTFLVKRISERLLEVCAQNNWFFSKSSTLMTLFNYKFVIMKKLKFIYSLRCFKDSSENE